MKNIFIKKLSILSVLFMSLMNTSCQDLLTDSISNFNDELKLSASSQEVVLDERKPNENLTFKWTTGTNKGTGAAISYVLQIDKEGDNFATPLEYEMGKNVFSYSLNWATLNSILLNTFGVQAGKAQNMEARIIATIASPNVAIQISKIAFTITTYVPVSKELYMVGSATSIGLNVSAALSMTLSTSLPGTFVYQGSLSSGTFKLPVNRDGCWCQDFYTKSSTDANMMIHNVGGSGQDLQWQITKAGQYKVTADLLNLTLTIEAIVGPPFSQIYIVGDASPSGWDVNNPKAFTQSQINPFIFTYEANFNSGSFKILAGAKGDWCGEWYRPLTDGQALFSNSVVQNSGCAVDNKWNISPVEVGRYKIELNTSNNTISIKKVDLYIIGDGGPNGWNIGTPTPMTYSNGNYNYTGQLNAGELKISKFKGDWCDGEWINSATANQNILNGSYIGTYACDGPDNKWKLQSGDAGNYQISINLDSQSMTIVRQ